MVTTSVRRFRHGAIGPLERSDDPAVARYGAAASPGQDAGRASCKGSEAQMYEEDGQKLKSAPATSLQRANPRMAVGCSGRVRVGSGRDAWHACRVIDISGAGAGVEIEGDLRPEATGETVSL